MSVHPAKKRGPAEPVEQSVDLNVDMALERKRQLEALARGEEYVAPTVEPEPEDEDLSEDEDDPSGSEDATGTDDD